MQLTINKSSKTLIVSGAVLFLLGLLQGATIPFFENPRMALSAHLAAVQSGMALVVFGTVWSLVRLSERVDGIVHISFALSMYLIWLAITLGAAFGASRALPISGSGHQASTLVETLTEVTVVTGSLIGILSFATIAFSLIRTALSK